jgi:hypothetical protein
VNEFQLYLAILVMLLAVRVPFVRAQLRRGGLLLAR